MKVRRCAAACEGGRSSTRALGLGLIILALIGLGTSTCGSTNEVVATCDVSEDCPSGAMCTDGVCVCAGGLRYCNGSCKPVAECSQGSGGAGSAGGGTGGEAGACATAADCEQPGDPRCGKATCSGGVCGLELKPFSKLASQRAGDCTERWCDGDGNLIEFTEASDFYDDGLPCTDDSCAAGKPVSALVPDADPCPGVGAGVCFEGACVACISDVVVCPGEPVCHYIYCVQPHCANGQWEPASGETDKNCGGPCRPCLLGYSCNVGSDCLSGVCAQGKCQAPTCSDGVRNDIETGVDCGGSPDCPLCPSGQGCKLPSECLSGVCWAGVCEAPSCTDGVMNGDEVGEDCGGLCEACP
jgi:hypothetical protein